MAAGRRLGVWLTIASLLAAGCHAAPPPVAVPITVPARPPLDLPLVQPDPIEPDQSSLPALDAIAADPAAVAAPPTGFRGVTEDLCRREAAARASTARLFEHEAQVPAGPDCTAALEELRGEVRTHLAAEARNRAALQALEYYFQLADAQGRGDLVRASLPVLDRLRGIAHKARADGLRLPVDPDDLDRQRAVVLGTLSQAELGATVFDIELKRRIGVAGGGGDRLAPTGPFPVTDQPIDVEGAVQVALQHRADLRLLRTVYWKLTPDTLPAARDLLRNQPGMPAVLGSTPAAPVRLSLLRRRSPTPDAAALAELELRRRQLYDLIADRERQAADEVRSAAAALTAQTRQVALARWRIEQARREVAEVADQGPLVVLPAELETYRARSEGVAAVMSWHQARVRLLAAQGLLGQ